MLTFVLIIVCRDGDCAGVVCNGWLSYRARNGHFYVGVASIHSDWISNKWMPISVSHYNIVCTWHPKQYCDCRLLFKITLIHKQWHAVFTFSSLSAPMVKRKIRTRFANTWLFQTSGPRSHDVSHSCAWSFVQVWTDLGELFCVDSIQHDFISATTYLLVPPNIARNKFVLDFRYLFEYDNDDTFWCSHSSTSTSRSASKLYSSRTRVQVQQYKYQVLHFWWEQ